MKIVSVFNSKNQLIIANIYEAVNPDRILIIASATGVKQLFYRKFADFLRLAEVTVITFDYQGIGQSLAGNIKNVTDTVSDWGETDMEAVIQFALCSYPWKKLVIMGHSIGGQLIGLAPSSRLADKMILVAAQSGYWRFWNGIDRFKMWFLWYVFLPGLVSLFGYLPAGKFSRMEHIPGKAARQWCRWCKQPEYLFSDIPPDRQYFDSIKCPVTALSIEGDPYAPRNAVIWLAQKYTAEVRHMKHFSKDDLGNIKVGHFGVFTERGINILWPWLLNEIRTA